MPAPPTQKERKGLVNGVTSICRVYDLTNEIVVSSHMTTLTYAYSGNKISTGQAHRSLPTMKAEQKLLASTSAVFSTLGQGRIQSKRYGQACHIYLRMRLQNAPSPFVVNNVMF